MRALLIGLALIAGLPSASSAQSRVRPAKGVFLVAKRSIDRGPFFHSVVLLLSHGEGGTLGLIVNRATEVPLSEALPDLGDEGGSHELYFGGPVGLEGLLFLFRSDDAPESAEGVMENVYFSGDRDILDEIMEVEKGPDELRLFLGHAGWAPRQLDNELLRGDWDVVRADAFTVFGKDPNTMWEELSKDGRVTARVSRE